MLAGNYDITEVFIDSALKICGDDIAAFESLVCDINTVTSAHGVQCVMTASVEPEALSEKVSGFIRA